jgi:S-ribosylhomocysteine lyase LuxS involved in autoinducer biosynthesis
MGCLTGFYFLTNISYSSEFWRKLVLECVEYILTQDTIPGAAELTCGNYQYFDLQRAKDFIRDVIIPNFSSEEFCSEYPYCQE